MRFSFQSDISHQLDDKLDEVDKFQAWKYMISLKENELDTYMSRDIPVPEGDKAQALHKKNLVKAKKIIVDSITDQLVQQVYSLDTEDVWFLNQAISR